jgi:UDP-3-O-[3-hydroxymyristoyl] glucosamine N-acyltransferase
MSKYEHGENLQIGPYVVIEEGCRIGENVTIEDFVVLKSGTIIEDGCTIRVGAKLGVAAFSFQTRKGERNRGAQKDVTVLENNVDVGYNAVVQCGLDRDTVNGAHTFINNLCNIGPDIRIGHRCVVGLGTRISGHTEIGADTITSPGVTILNRVKIGNNVHIGIGSLVLHDVPDDTHVAGRPSNWTNTRRKERLSSSSWA